MHLFPKSRPSIAFKEGLIHAEAQRQPEYEKLSSERRVLLIEIDALLKDAKTLDVKVFGEPSQRSEELVEDVETRKYVLEQGNDYRAILKRHREITEQVKQIDTQLYIIIEAIKAAQGGKITELLENERVLDL